MPKYSVIVYSETQEQFSVEASSKEDAVKLAVEGNLSPESSGDNGISDVVINTSEDELIEQLMNDHDDYNERMMNSRDFE